MMNNKNLPVELVRNKSMLDLLQHEIVQICRGDRALSRIEKTIMHPEILKTLSFEQLIQYMDRVMRRQKEGRDFLVDFYRVTGKSQEVQNLLKQYMMASAPGASDISQNMEEDTFATKQKLLSKLEMFLKLADKVDSDE